MSIFSINNKKMTKIMGYVQFITMKLRHSKRNIGQVHHKTHKHPIK
jgi:hypothetical protein